MELISKNISNDTGSAVSHLDSPSFLQFLKHLGDLRKEILDNKEHEISPQSFLVFLDKISGLTNTDKLNEYIMRKLSEINIDMLDVEKMLNAYQQHSVDDKFEESLRIEEIKKFASGVSPDSITCFRLYQKRDLFLIIIKSAISMSPERFKINL